DRLEAALRQAAVERHLAALEGVQRDAGARLLTLVAAAGGLALARADAAPDAHAPLVGALVVADLVELHRRRSSIRSRPAPGAEPCGSCRAPKECPPARGCGEACSGR